MSKEKPDNDLPLADTSVSLQLSLIQQRVSELLDEEEFDSGLRLLDDERIQSDSTDPYNRLRWRQQG